MGLRICCGAIISIEMKLNENNSPSLEFYHYGRNSFHIFNMFVSQKLNAFSYWIHSAFVFIQNGFEKKSNKHRLFPPIPEVFILFLFPLPPLHTKNYYPLSFVCSVSRLTV